MGKVVLILAVVAAGLGLTSLHLVNQLREGDAAIAELKTQVASLQEQVAAAQRTAAAREPIVTDAIEQPRDDLASPLKEAPKEASREAPKVAAAQPVGAMSASTFGTAPSREESMRMMREQRERQRQLMQDPEYRDAMRLQSRGNFARQYPGVIQELGLDRQQADEFFEMLADQQLRMSEQMEPLWDVDVSGTSDPAALQERHQRIQQAAAEAQRKNEAELASRFGQDKLQAWKEYQSTVGQRYQLEHMRNTLAAQGLPLNEDASKPMLKALAAAQKAEVEEYTAASRGATPTAGRLVAYGAFENNTERQVEMTKKRNQRTLDAVSPYLTFEQRQALEQEQDAQLKMLEAQMRIMRTRSSNGASNGLTDVNSQLVIVPQ